MKAPLPISSCPSCRRKILRSFDTTTLRAYSRPSAAPKVNVDIKPIRRSPGLYEQNCVDRRYDALKQNSWRILELSETARKAAHDSRPLREQINKIHAQLPKAGQEKDALLLQAKELQPLLAAYDRTQKTSEREIQELAEALPNLTSQHTPVGDEPEEVAVFNESPVKRHPHRAHWMSHDAIGAELDLLDFEGSALTSGWGWYFLKNEAAMLEHALVQHALSIAMQRGWCVVSPPSMVYAHMADACGFQPRDKSDEQQIYAIQQTEKDAAKPRLVMAGTAEIPLAGMKANYTFAEAELPLKLIGASRCYRAEAGARGVETKGLYRVHEFTKVEMFGWTLPDMPSTTGPGSTTPSPPTSATDMFDTASANLTSHSEALFAEMIELQEAILTPLGLHCRILEMPSHDLGASASRKRDIEALFPSRMRPAADDAGSGERSGGWGELTSASICTDYQSRRLNTRVKLSNDRGAPLAGKLEYPHTVNGTALAVPRVLACLLETHYDPEAKRVEIPEVLRPWMGGQHYIERKSKA